MSMHGDHFREAVLNAVVGSKTQLVTPPALAGVLSAGLKTSPANIKCGQGARCHDLEP